MKEGWQQSHTHLKSWPLELLRSLRCMLDNQAAFKEMAKCPLSALGKGGQVLKRRKETGGSIGVSPDALKQRPRTNKTRKGQLSSVNSEIFELAL